MNRRGFARSAAVLAALAVAQLASAASPAPPLRFTVDAAGHPLAVWARVPPVPRGSVVLLHGRTWSARPAFDLQVPGLQRSVLESLAAQGFAAYALDARGYGDTPRDPSGWLTPKRAAADAAVVLAWVAARHPTLKRPALVGWSLGGSIAHLIAAASPSLVSSLVLYGYAPDPDVTIDTEETSDRPLKMKNTREFAAADFVSPKVTPKSVVRAFVDTAIRTDPIRVDWQHGEQFTYDSSLLTMPTLIIYGDRDSSIDPVSAARFFTAVDQATKQLVVIPEGDHCAHLENTHPEWVAAVVGFLGRVSASR